MSESVVVVIKPDAIKENLTHNIINEFVKNGLEIVSDTSILLSESMIRRTHVIRDEEKHAEYLMESPVHAFLLKGKDAISIARIKKGEIRKIYGRNDHRNLIHTTEAGNEFEIQAPLFFPDIDLGKIPRFADLQVKDGRCYTEKGLLAVINYIRSNAFLSESAIELPFDRVDRLSGILNSEDVEGKIGIFIEKVIKNINYQVHYRPGDLLKECPQSIKTLEDLNIFSNSTNGTVMIGTQDCSREINDDFFMRHSDYAIDMLACYSPLYSLDETDRIRAIAFKNGYRIFGGSCGVAPIGYYTVSKEMFEIYTTKLLEKSKRSEYAQAK